MSLQQPPDGVPPGAAETLPTLVDLLVRRADQHPDRPALSFSRDGEEHDSSRLTYAELDAGARRIALDLKEQGAAGERVLVLCPPGLEFIAGFFGCLYAGAVAVPVHPPLRDHLIPRVESIIADMQPGFALATVEIQEKIRATVDGLASGRPLLWCSADLTPAGDHGLWSAPGIDADSVAMVQYTSGSTSAPKGVVLTHGNLMHNLETIRQAWSHEFGTLATGVFWLPPFHDMGLIGGLLETLYVGGHSILMPPTAFIKRPMRWLEAISRHRATITAAPNFAYDMCVELSTPEQRAALDLSHWAAALCGAEPVRTATLEAFADAFAPSGFRPEAFLPVYGLAEGTLLVSGGSESPVPVVRHIDRAALRDNRIVDVAPEHPTGASLVGCGQPRGGQRVIIVDPETRTQCPSDGVGEIWVAGPSVAHGYLGAAEQSEETFNARLSDTGDGPFLRTGDLGFLHSGELFVTGRRKDLIIIRGNNHYPNDIELTVQNCNPALLRGRGAVFSIPPQPGAAEQLVIVQEVDPSRLSEAELTDVMQQIRAAVTERHAVRTHAVVLVQPLQLPTTSSGKIQRRTCKQLFTDGELPVVAQWPAAAPEARPAAPAAPAQPESGAPAAAEIADWLLARLSRDLELPAAEIDPAQPFAVYGLDSIHAVRLTTALEEWLGREFSPTLAYEYPTIDLLAAHLAQPEDASAPRAPADAGTTAGVPDEPVAIVGIGCRFPGADGPAAFWQLISGGVDATGDVPPDRWDADAFYNPDPSVPGTAVTRRGGFLDEVDEFDHRFFGISPREAAQMDPQQRLLLEVAWEALEDAGQVPEQLAGSRTGVFVGIATNDYGYLRLGRPELVDAYTGTGNALSIAANRLSYAFDFHGPSMAIDTACSSSLVAVDLACRSLRDGECTLALAGGVNIILSPALAINFSKARVMAPDGRCKTFDADADGYVRGEGAGVVVLKPLSQALAAGDPVYAVIRGSATNSDGRTNGLIAPSEHAQEAVLASAYRRAGLSPGAVQYVEAHGTGTSLGDAIEAKALGTVLTDGRPPGSRCLVGSVKTNIGHLEAAAGVAGLIKVALALQHRSIPPSLHFTAPNPHIPFDSLPLEVVQARTPWPDHGGRAVAGVSSFGFGGTNAHVVLTEAPQVRAAPSAQDAAQGRAELLTLSARSPEALTAMVGEYEMALFANFSFTSFSESHHETVLTDLCYTAGARRGHHEYRLGVIGDSQAAMFESLAAYRHGESRAGLSTGHCRPGHPPAVTFVFSGQGSQWLGMGQRLRVEEPVFAEALHACDSALRPYLGRSVAAALADETGIPDIGLIQPAIFAVQVALAALWRSWGVRPAAVVGHSMGEVAAAHVVGALSLDDAARVIAARAQALRQVRGRGAMLVAEVTVDEAGDLVAGRESQVAVAASNSHRSTVLSGDRTVLADLMTVLERRERFCRWIDVDVASHSPQMDALASELRGALAGLRPVAPAVPIYSTVTGDLLGERLLGPDYWAENLCSPVRFSPALRRLLANGHDTFVEISPHPILLIAAREDAEDMGQACTLLPSMRRDDEGRATMLGSLGALYTRGYDIAWEQLYPSGARCVSAPTYPWQRVRCWLEAGSVAAPGHTAVESAGPLPWRGPLRSAADPRTTLAEIEIGTGALPELADHQVNGSAVLPVAMLLQLVLSGAAKAFGPRNRVIRDVAWHQSLEFTDAEPRTVQIVLHGDPAGPVSFQCYSAGPGDWSLLADGTVDTGQASATDMPDSLGAARSRCASEVPGASFYRRLADHGLRYGPAFQAVETVWRRDGEAVARLRAPDSAGEIADLGAAVLLDACLQTLAAALPASAVAVGKRLVYLPTELAELRADRSLADGVFCHAVLRSEPGPTGTVTGDVFLLDEGGATVAVARGLRLQPVSAAPATTESLRDRIYQIDWQLADRPPDADTRPMAAGSWLVFSDGGTAADTVRDGLEARSQTCVLVTPGEEFQRVAPDSYRIDPAQPEHFRRLLTEAFGGQLPPCRGVVHLWSLLAPEPQRPDSLEAATTVGSLSVLHLVQALSSAGWPDPPRLWLVTRGVQAVSTTDAQTQPVSVAQAPVWGLSRSIDHEHPELHCSCVDLSAGGGPEEFRALSAEVCADGPEADVALRGSHRYVARLGRYPRIPDGAFPGFHRDASYLITGGLGALGCVMARWMAAHGARHLVLTGRGAPSATAQAALDELRAGGTEVTVARGDVTKADDVSAILESISTSLPPLRGIVHAAGLVDDAIVERLDERQLRDVLAPKVQGAWNLHALTRDLPLDFFVLFSSAASVLGSPGAANYGAANAFLDALSRHRRATGRPALSINWGPWSELGFFTRSELHRHFTQYGVEAMPADEYLQVLSWLLTQNTTQAVTQVMVLDIDWTRWRPGARPAMLNDLAHETPDTAGAVGVASGIYQALQDAAAGERQGLIESYLRDLVAGKLGVAPATLDVQAPLSGLGVDSLITLEMRIQVERELGVVVPVTRLLDGPSVAGLSGWLVDQLPETGPARPSVHRPAPETNVARKVDPPAPHPLSYGQKSLWFVHKLAPASAAYTIVYGGRISGELDVPALERAAQALLDRHPMLRTTYTERDGQPVQLVHPHWPVRIAQHDLGSGDGSGEAGLDEWIQRETNRPFDLSTGPVLRLTLLRRAPDHHVLVMAVHHIAVDFWSIDVILDELRLLYAAEHGAAAPPPPAESYVDYADQQARALAGAEGERLWDYWSRQLGGDLPVLALPTDRPRPSVQTYRGAIHRFSVDARIADGLRQAGRAAGATPYMTLLAAYAVLLHRYSGQDDLLVGSPFACRDRAGLTGVVGYFSNPVALRFDVGDDPSFASLLDQVKDTVLGAIAHQDYPFPLLVERLRPARDAARTPLFQVSFAWEQTRRFSEASGAPDGELPLETSYIGQGGAPFDVLLQMGEHGPENARELACALQYNTDLFDAATIERMAGHFTALLSGIVADPGQRVSQLPLLTQAEHRLLAAWNDTAVDYDAPGSVHELVAATAARTPDAVAVTCADRELTYTELTYAELDARSNALAHRLQRYGVGPDTVVPVLLDRSEDLVIALLAVLKAGGAFLPLDSAQPTQRMAAMLADLPDAPVCVTHRRQLDHVPTSFTGARLCLDQPSPGPEDTTAPSAGTTPDSLAYVIYTSGSTGTPKGALNTHAGIRNRLLWMQDAYPLTADDRVLHKTPVSFDPFVWEIFWPLITGARVVIAKPEGHKDAGYLVRTIVENDITTMHFVPSMLRRFLAQPEVTDCVTLHRVFCSGEVLPAELRDEFWDTLDAELYNLYGPTEAAIDVTGFHCRRGESGPVIPIGRPIANVEIHLLDPHRQPVPVGVPGELYIGGAGVGRGYLNRPDTTAASFVADPDHPDRLLYRTGDLARYAPDGNIEYLGRLDNQVKVGGFRIEPGEIEAALAGHPAVAESAVVAQHTGNPLLCAHIVVRDGAAPPSTAELRRFLLELLPAAMVPGVFHTLDALPLTASGKVDRRALLVTDEDLGARQAEFVAPRNRTEEALAQIWCEVLSVDRVGVHDDFFALGGASTQSLEVAVRANDIGMALQPESMFVYGTIADLAAEYGPVTGEEIRAEERDTAEPKPAAPVARVRALPPGTPNTVIESLGVYLPPRAVSTETVLADCVNEVRIPLERLTGIKSRRMAGDDEFSIDLARKAATDCLSRSSYRPEDIDLIIACNISRYDGPERFTFEPGTAAQLREQCGLNSAVCFDINNACAGMFTGITVADAFLKADLIRSALVVSGEYITHITETAQQEIEGPMDPRLACLTVGDAGAAVVLERGPSDRVGFHDIDMATLSEYAKLCIGKATDGPHGGAIMVTDSVTQTAVAVKHSVPYVTGVMERHGWQPETCDHLLMHQTSEASINDAIRAINQGLGRNAASRNNTICNLAERGNTATTTHFVALADYIRDNRINSGDNVVFSITGSGQTVGTALYTFDDLPDRMRRDPGGQNRRGRHGGEARKDLPSTPRVRIDSVGIAPDGSQEWGGSIRLAVQAGAACLDGSDLDRSALGLIIHTGVYRDDFLSEPAVASLVAGELGINAVVDSPDGPKTLDFDILNGAVGFLNACHVATGMIAAGKTGHAMVLASEVENNGPDSGYPRTGITETGSAVLLSPSDGPEGFGRFVFAHHPEYSTALATYTQPRDGRTRLQVERDPNLAAIFGSCLPAAAKELLALEGLDPADISLVFGPQLPPPALDELAAQIGVPRSRFVDLGAGTDPFTSMLPLGLEHARRHGLTQPGDVALILAVGSGVEVGCTTYRF